LTYET